MLDTNYFLYDNKYYLYYRYIDDVFMTSNISVNDIHAHVDWTDKKDEKHIQITYWLQHSQINPL